MKKLMNFLDESALERSKQACERKVMDVVNRSDELRLLIGAMRKYGCNFNIARHVVCERCSRCVGGFDPDTKQIVVCLGATFSKSKIMSILMHEMIHMFDYCRFKFDFNNLEHIACSEIRASNITYCSISDRINHRGPGKFDFKQTHQYCVKDVAFGSVKSYSPETSDEDLWKIVNKVFPYCYNDLEPFGRRATNGIRDLKQSYRERYYYGYE